MLHTTRWSPDTCGCVLEYSWDDAVPDDQRMHTFERMIATCPDHSGLGTGPLRFLAVDGENKRKNRLLDDLRGVQADLRDDEYVWSFDDNRVLVVQLPARVNAQKRATLQTLADTKFGVGRVRVL